MVARDMDKKHSNWEIKMTNFKQLMELVKKYGEIIISPIDDTANYNYGIEIYDSYRE